VTVALLAVLVAAWRLGQWFRRRPRRRRPQATTPADLALLTDLTALGLVAGLSFPSSLAEAGRHAAPPLAAAVRRIGRDARVEGSVAAYAGADGDLAPLLGLVAGAMATGAPVAAAVAGFGVQIREEQRVRAVAAARRLAVHLLFPLALLILPGFIVLIVGPVAIESLARLDL
jgi:hypothetical protein